MIRVNENEIFPITVALVDETTRKAATGKTVYYDVRRQPGDLPLTPIMSGVLTESTVEAGIYTGTRAIDTEGTYIVYATCSGFLSSTEEIVVNPENIYDVTKYNRHYNTSVEDVTRTTAIPTASQVVRKVGLGKTDYVITRIKPEYAADWSHPDTVSGSIFAHYRQLDDDIPYLVGGSGV